MHSIICKGYLQRGFRVGHADGAAHSLEFDRVKDACDVFVIVLTVPMLSRRLDKGMKARVGGVKHGDAKERAIASS
jgi:hypothetical protein